MEQAAQDDIYGIAQRTLEAHKAKTEFMRMFTSEAVKKVDDASLDYVYVGGWVRCGGGGGGGGCRGGGGNLLECRVGDALSGWLARLGYPQRRCCPCPLLCPLPLPQMLGTITAAAWKTWRAGGQKLRREASWRGTTICERSHLLCRAGAVPCRPGLPASLCTRPPDSPSASRPPPTPVGRRERSRLSTTPRTGDCA